MNLEVFNDCLADKCQPCVDVFVIFDDEHFILLLKKGEKQY